jgi:hypothetical protein
MIPAAIMQIADLIDQFGLVLIRSTVKEWLPFTWSVSSHLRKPSRAQRTLAATQLHGGDGKLFT